MNPKIALTFAVAVVLVALAMVGEDGEVAKIAERGKPPAVQEESGGDGSNWAEGFASEEEIAPQIGQPQGDGQRLGSAALGAQPRIGAFTFQDGAEAPPIKVGAIAPSENREDATLRDRTGLLPGQQRLNFDPRIG